jgi:hypothetical protein
MMSQQSGNGLKSRVSLIEINDGAAGFWGAVVYFPECRLAATDWRS